MLQANACISLFFFVPNFEEVRVHIASGLSVCLFVYASIPYAYSFLRTMNAKDLEYYIWIHHKNC